MLRLGVIPAVGLVLFAGCDDSLLPPDYSGLPIARVNGNVDEPARDTVAHNPRMSLEWLDGRAMVDASNTLLGQSVSFRRADRIQNDWEISLGIPREGAAFDPHEDTTGISIAVGKVVYFDDRVPDGVLDWRCADPSCDSIASISSQIVLFVFNPPRCYNDMGLAVRDRISRGYHFFDRRELDAVEIGPDEALSFQRTNSIPALSNPTVQLRDFTRQLVSSWASTRAGGC